MLVRILALVIKHAARRKFSSESLYLLASYVGFRANTVSSIDGNYLVITLFSLW